MFVLSDSINNRNRSFCRSKIVFLSLTNLKSYTTSSWALDLKKSDDTASKITVILIRVE
jgi:hypothetical protein